MTALDDALAAGAQAPARGEMTAPPTTHLAVVTCMDARLDPLRDLGLAIGQAHVLRNAGGRVTDDTLRSLLLSWHELGTREVLVVHHSGCGVQAADEAVVKARLEAKTGTDLSGVELRTFDDEEQSVREDVARIAAAPFAPLGLRVRGAIQDLATGRVVPVEGAEA
ncbi:MAG: beta-class carbonic anhydrase [Actinomycetes bacterium]